MKLSKEAIAFCSVCSPKVSPQGCCHPKPIKAAEALMKALTALEAVKILGDAKWKSERARQTKDELKDIFKNP